jgi:uncharacterized protein YcfL
MSSVSQGLPRNYTSAMKNAQTLYRQAISQTGGKANAQKAWRAASHARNLATTTRQKTAANTLRNNAHSRLLEHTRNRDIRIKYEYFWYNGLTCSSLHTKEQRIVSELYPSTQHAIARLNYRCAPSGTKTRILNQLVGANSQNILGQNSVLNYVFLDNWFERQYQEVRNALETKQKVVLAGHSHGGLIVTYIAERLNKELGPSELSKLTVITLGSVRWLSPNSIPKIKKFYQILNVGDFALIASGVIAPRPYTRTNRVSQNNKMLWNSSNINWKFHKPMNTTVNKTKGIRWLWPESGFSRGHFSRLPFPSGHISYNYSGLHQAVKNYFVPRL